MVRAIILLWKKIGYFWSFLKCHIVYIYRSFRLIYDFSIWLYWLLVCWLAFSSWYLIAIPKWNKLVTRTSICLSVLLSYSFGWEAGALVHHSRTDKYVSCETISHPLDSFQSGNILSTTATNRVTHIMKGPVKIGFMSLLERGCILSFSFS